MKISNQMRINDEELKALYKLLKIKTNCFIDHYNENGTPVYVYSKQNEIYMLLCHKMMREYINRGL